MSELRAGQRRAEQIQHSDNGSAPATGRPGQGSSTPVENRVRKNSTIVPSTRSERGREDGTGNDESETSPGEREQQDHSGDEEGAG